MHDYLYEHQQALDDAHLEKYARILGLDMVKFKNDFYEHVYAGRVREDFLSGVRSGVYAIVQCKISSEFNECRYTYKRAYTPILI